MDTTVHGRMRGCLLNGGGTKAREGGSAGTLRVLCAAGSFSSGPEMEASKRGYEPGNDAAVVS